MLDDVDRRILRQFQAAPDVSIAELADRCSLTTASCWRRLEKLESSGIILGQEVVVDWQALGFAVEVSLRITLDKTQTTAFDEFLAKARTVPEVLEIHEVSGEFTYLVKVRTHDTHDLSRIIKEEIGQIDNVSAVNSVMTLKTFKESTKIPLDTK